MKEGRAPRAADEIVVNEAFAERMRWGDKALNHPLRTEGKNFKVVGILKISYRFLLPATGCHNVRIYPYFR